VRPTIINGAYTRVNGVDFPIGMWSLDQYQAQAVKANGGIVQRMVFINDAPLATVYLYPTPSQSGAITLDAPRILTNIPSIATVMDLPPAYARALQYAVAEELAPDYGAAIDVSARARATKAVIKRANRTAPISGFDSTILGGYNYARGFWGGFY
jgi:hypothetical protein